MQTQKWQQKLLTESVVYTWPTNFKADINNREKQLIRSSSSNCGSPGTGALETDDTGKVPSMEKTVKLVQLSRVQSIEREREGTDSCSEKLNRLT